MGIVVATMDIQNWGEKRSQDTLSTTHRTHTHTQPSSRCPPPPHFETYRTPGIASLSVTLPPEPKSTERLGQEITKDNTVGRFVQTATPNGSYLE